MENLEIIYNARYERGIVTFLRRRESVTGLVFLLENISRYRYKLKAYHCLIDDEFEYGKEGDEKVYNGSGRTKLYKAIKGSRNAIEIDVLEISRRWARIPEKEIIRKFGLTIH